MKYIFLTIFGLVLVESAFAQEATPEHKDSLNAVLNKYYELNVKIFQAGSKPSDIDELFEIFTEDFTYKHPKYGGTYTREDLYNGYMNNQKNGGYDGSVIDIKVETKIIGLNAVAVQKRYIEKDAEGKLEMAVFEFKAGKISRIYEYW